ncbi:zf-TFIIB domain-containing protein [bacterium]|nr:zf-TFIIB domain-containing protein [bacterium]
MAECIKCSGEVSKYQYEGILFEMCKSCSSLIISKDNFEKICSRIDAECEIIDLFEQPVVKSKEDLRTCPHCGLKMEKVLCNGVLVDRCKKCQLLYFDNGELAKYFSVFSKKNIEIVSNARFIKEYCDVKEVKMETQNYNNISQEPSFKIQAKEREFDAHPVDGWVFVGFLVLMGVLAAICFFSPFTAIFSVIIIFLMLFLTSGFKIIAPQEALVLTLFGKYCGTIKKAGFHWVNPFCRSYNGIGWGTVSLKTRTLDNPKQKINDKLGNPIEIGIMVTWEIKDTAKAVFNVNDYHTFLSAQCDSALRNIARRYPYDSPEDSSVESLRNDSLEISEQLKKEIQSVVSIAGINIIGARITHLAYSTEIAAAMLQRQQACAVVEAKRAIVDGAVGIVEMALDKLAENKNIVLDDKTKANMVNNLLVVLCANKESMPVIRNDVI